MKRRGLATFPIACLYSTSSSQCHHHILNIVKTSLNKLARCGLLLVSFVHSFLGAVA